MLSITLRQLEYATAVARTESVSLAAEVLHVSQPALSVALSQLEAHLGQPLFLRRPGGPMRPTSFGRGFLESAERILADLTRLTEGTDLRPAPAAGDPLSAAFAKRQGAVEACLERHKDAAATAGQLTLRFEIDAAGAPTKVDLAPAAVAAGPLGACITAVGRSTRFPPQGGATTFRINLQVSQQPGHP